MKLDGTVWSRVDNTYGQLGNGTTTTAATPIQVPGLTFTRTSAGIVLGGSPGQFQGIGHGRSLTR